MGFLQSTYVQRTEDDLPKEYKVIRMKGNLLEVLYKRLMFYANINWLFDPDPNENLQGQTDQFINYMVV